MKALYVKLDNVRRLKLQVLQVENARLQEVNPNVSAEFDRECTKTEELP